MDSTGKPNDLILEMRNISKTFPGVRALDDVSFACRRGEVHALVGENGAGKSTLIKILAGAYHPDAGLIYFKGQTLTNLIPRLARDLGISIIYQEFNLIPYLSVAENIFLGREPCTALGLVDYSKLDADAAAILDRLDVSLDQHALVAELTVAQQQMVEISKALSFAADLIVMDEPSAALAGHELERLFDMIRLLRQQGVTIIYISHRLNEVFEIADRVTVLKDGRVVGTVSVRETNRTELIRMMVGRSLDDTFPRRTRPLGEPLLAVRNLSAGRVHDVNFTLHRGEILGLAGLVGAGRTELVRALFGADPIEGGEIVLDGRPLARLTPAQAAANGLVLVPEDRKAQGLMLGLPVRNNITLTVLNRLTRLMLIRRPMETKIVQSAARDFGIRMASPNQEVQYLSGGNQQKVVLAKWLIRSPRVIILDEPTRGIDVGAKFEIYALMRALADQGAGILMSSSELPEVLGMSDRILVMHEGRLADVLNRAESSEEQIMFLATGHSLAEMMANSEGVSR